MDTLRGYGHGGNRRSDRRRICDVDRLTIGRAAFLVGDCADGLPGKKVVEHGVAELVRAMDEGRISVSLAARVADEEPEVQSEIVRADVSDATKVTKQIRAVKQRRRIRRQQEGERASLELLAPGQDDHRRSIRRPRCPRPLRPALRHHRRAVGAGRPRCVHPRLGVPLGEMRGGLHRRVLEPAIRAGGAGPGSTTHCKGTSSSRSSSGMPERHAAHSRRLFKQPGSRFRLPTDGVRRARPRPREELDRGTARQGLPPRRLAADHLLSGGLKRRPCRSRSRSCDG